MNQEAQGSVDLTVLVCTYNRCADLRELLESVIAQETRGAFTYEVLVVDNNSNDDTRGVVESFIAAGQGNFRYLFEGRQGRSYALNTGLGEARGAIYVLADDDIILPTDYLSNVFDAFQAHPEVTFVGGKVLPRWKGEVPPWLTPRHWSAIAMTDYGESEFYTDESHQICLLAGSFRRADVNAVGGYHQELGVSKGRIGGTEDVDLFARLFKAGRRGLYLPHVELYHKVEPERLTKAYHRRWHTGHGRHYAVMRAAEVENAKARLFDVPAHLYKQAAKDVAGWVQNSLRGRRDEAFWHETQLRFFAGFFSKRREDFLASGRRSSVGEIALFVRLLATGKDPRHTQGDA
jgi:glycosyltransferase involved in cell wall biosynthesis